MNAYLTAPFYRRTHSISGHTARFRREVSLSSKAIKEVRPQGPSQPDIMYHPRFWLFTAESITSGSITERSFCAPIVRASVMMLSMIRGLPWERLFTDAIAASVMIEGAPPAMEILCRTYSGTSVSESPVKS